MGPGTTILIFLWSNLKVWKIERFACLNLTLPPFDYVGHELLKTLRGYGTLRVELARGHKKNTPFDFPRGHKKTRGSPATQNFFVKKFWSGHRLATIPAGMVPAPSFDSPRVLQNQKPTKHPLCGLRFCGPHTN